MSKTNKAWVAEVLGTTGWCRVATTNSYKAAERALNNFLNKAAVEYTETRVLEVSW